MIRAAGILFIAGNRVLLVRRSAEGDHEGEWALPGGKIEDGETPEQAAVRECQEELGGCPEGERVLFARRQDATVDYTTFKQAVPEPFRPALNGEHDGFTWAEIGDWPRDIHPGARVVLAKLTMDELDIARAIVAGELTSPQRYMNMALFDIRITGTGTAYREALKEYVYRPPENYLTDDFLARCNGLPVILEHPPTQALDTKEFAERVIGTILLPYLKNDEVWGIAKILDMPAAQMMEQEQLSTSPAVIFRPLGGNEKIKLEDGQHLLIEGRPSLLDHIAVCENGVWDRDGGPTGVNSVTAGDNQVSETAAAAVPMNGKIPAADAADPLADREGGDKLDKILSHMDSLHAKCDSMVAKHDAMSSRMDAFEARLPKPEGAADGGSMPTPTMPPVATADRRDGAEPDRGLEAERVENGLKAADAARKDAEEAKKDAAEARKDAAEALRRATPAPEEDTAAMADEQARADSVMQVLGKQAPRPLGGETLLGYRRRLTGMLRDYSPKWKTVDLAKVGEDVLGLAQVDIYNDARTAGLRPVDVPAGTFREVVRVDPYSNVRTVDFYGPQTIFETLAGRSQCVTAFRTKAAA